MGLFYGAARGSSARPRRLSHMSSTPVPAVSQARLTLYQRDDCHLCDLALEVLAAARSPEFDSVFIDGDEALEQRYGVRVPVLRDQRSGAELDWPFDVAGVCGFLSPPVAG